MGSFAERFLWQIATTGAGFRTGFLRALFYDSSKFRNGEPFFDPFSEPNSSIPEFRNFANYPKNAK
jgi:hypothetical protein